MIERFVFKELKAHLAKPQVTVITGMRRVGKSTALKYLMNLVPHKKTAGQLSFQMINMTTSQTFDLQTPTQELQGDFQKDFSTAAMPSGTYIIRAVFQGKQYSQTVVKP